MPDAVLVIQTKYDAHVNSQRFGPIGLKAKMY